MLFIDLVGLGSFVSKGDSVLCSDLDVLARFLMDQGCADVCFSYIPTTAFPALAWRPPAEFDQPTS